VGKKRNGTLEKIWLYQNGLNVVAEFNGSGTLISRFVYGSRSNVPDYMVTADGTYRIISDQLGSVRRVVNASTGELKQRLEYDAWGQVLMDTSPGFQPFGYAGGLYDPDTKLVRFGARDYDASVGRWTCKDPRVAEASRGSLYSYAACDPVDRTDFLGLSWQYYKNWGGPGWMNGNSRHRETDQPPAPHLPGQPEYVAPADARDELYREHDVDIMHCATIKDDKLRQQCRREADIGLASKIWRVNEDHPNDLCGKIWLSRRADELIFWIPNRWTPGGSPGPGPR
jgi:RHS repeat-associated protein